MNTTHEEWRPVVGWEGLYEVSDQGRVRSVERVVPWGSKGSRRIIPRVLKFGRTQKGVLNVSLSNGPIHRTAPVHLLVLEAFVGTRPVGLVGCHWDDDKENNQLPNLRWDTPSANEQDKLRNGNHPQVNKTRCSRGHEYSPQNTWRDNQNRRYCRACRKVRELAKNLR